MGLGRAGSCSHKLKYEYFSLANCSQTVMARKIFFNVRLRLTGRDGAFFAFFMRFADILVIIAFPDFFGVFSDRETRAPPAFLRVLFFQRNDLIGDVARGRFIRGSRGWCRRDAHGPFANHCKRSQHGTSSFSVETAIFCAFGQVST